MLETICLGCGNTLRDCPRYQLPICIRCRDQLNGLTIGQRVQLYVAIKGAVDASGFVMACQRAANALLELADKVPNENGGDDTLWDLETPGFEE